MTINYVRNEIIKFSKRYLNIDNGPSKLRFGTALVRMSTIDVAL